MTNIAKGGSAGQTENLFPNLTLPNRILYSTNIDKVFQI